MALNNLLYLKPHLTKYFRYTGRNLHICQIKMQTVKPLEMDNDTVKSETKNETLDEQTPVNSGLSNVSSDLPRIVPMVLNTKEPIVLPFDEVPGPRSLKYLSIFRNYITEIGTQVTAGLLTFGLNVGTILSNRKTTRSFSNLFDKYGPVVRFVSPVGSDIVLINHPDHIQKVFSMEGEYPVRSTLQSLEKYRVEHKNHIFGGLYTVQGQDWLRQRSVMHNPTHNAFVPHAQSLNGVCEKFTEKIYNIRNYQDELSKDLHKEIHKWAFDCMGLILFSKNFQLLETELVYSQCDESWMYHSLEKATDAIIKCESGIHFWKFFTTPAWYSLVKHCDNLDNLIGKYVLDIEQEMSKIQDNPISPNSLTSAMLLSEDKFNAEDIATILMDVMLIGINTISSSMSFLLYYIAKHQMNQRLLYQEVGNLYQDVNDIEKFKDNTPYLQACIKETMRLVPPIPLLTRILSRNVTLDNYNIPRGTMIIMSTQDTSLKEGNFDDATRFCPERWLKPEAKNYHAFASIPFGYGARKCIGQNVAETMMSLLTIKVLQKYRLEYHYGDVQPSQGFIARPNKPLKIRFIDRM
ncbi:probable cytochrome P450 301a1, mitochondrial [Vanessa cardui]|uniref:probable cytochrome P450 301a1, mitochondrial n=1 Tax=Vanessa cardui TaxID=171605 RepID=UPI001F13C520|nr:probable cytochrome P450 301a1, mitochondrial [Vanessa cardui]